ncbi:hypothetical protein [Rheinheimera sp.]|uniref:hypothetical protein n=1 Tax=Rheinheimera sp. TaxID=1869214 RepID=UPI00273489EE|nr:hypothetical protein [Rheinheimera sp.]MDP2713717.1 hypothetical protein [Rheinheimera sp.]
MVEKISEQHIARKSVCWRIYAWVIVVQAVGATIATLYYDDYGVKDVVDLAFIVTGVVGLMAYAYGLRIGAAGFWRLFLPMFVLWDLFFRLVIMKPAPEGDSVSHYLLLCALLLLLVPQYIAIYRYQQNIALS